MVQNNICIPSRQMQHFKSWLYEKNKIPHLLSTVCITSITKCSKISFKLIQQNELFFALTTYIEGLFYILINLSE